MKPLLAVAAATALLLLVPLVAMQFGAEVSWAPGDFVAAGVLLFGGGAAMVLAVRRLDTPAQRAMACAGVALLVLLVWAELAVGLFR